MLMTAAKVYGAIFVIIGVLGFIPAVTPQEHLLGIFHVNAAHNIVHLLTGLVALLVGFSNNRACRVFFLTFGIIYGIVAFLGFVAGGRPLFGLLAYNIPDAWFHLAISAISIFLGVLPSREGQSYREEHATA
ncbi:MAG: DUF4383 domain-containing protein [Limisphaerales bacterium]